MKTGGVRILLRLIIAVLFRENVEFFLDLYM